MGNRHIRYDETEVAERMAYEFTRALTGLDQVMDAWCEQVNGNETELLAAYERSLTQTDPTQ